jgi:hypothetical protein
LRIIIAKYRKEKSNKIFSFTNVHSNHKLSNIYNAKILINNLRGKKLNIFSEPIFSDASDSENGSHIIADASRTDIESDSSIPDDVFEDGKKKVKTLIKLIYKKKSVLKSP